MRKIFSVDRIEGDIAVCISDDDDTLDVEITSLMGLGLHDVFSAEYDGEKILDIVPMPDERDRRLNSNRERLRRLIERSKK
jgi:hypothetical protein